MGFFDFLKPRPVVVPERVRDFSTFEARVLESELPVIIDVWGASCAPCKQLEPILVDVATRYEGRVRVVEICTEGTDPQLLSQLGVRATPTIILYKGGDEVGRTTGLRPAGWFDQMISVELDA